MMVLRYLSKIIGIQKYYIVFLLAVCIGLIHLTFNIEYNQNCTPRHMYSGNFKQCPVLIYCQIQIRNIMTMLFFQQFILFLMLINFQQIKRRKVVLYLSFLLFVIYVVQKSLRYFVQFDLLFERYRMGCIFVLLLISKIYSKHKIRVQFVKFLFMLIYIILVVIALFYTIENL